MKKCAVKYDVSAVVLKERIKQQEEEYTRDLEAGVIPLQPEVKKKKKIRVATSTSSAVRAEEPIR